MKTFDKFCTVLDRIASVITVALMIILTVLVAMFALIRFLLNLSATWQNDVAVLFLPWIVFIGMAITFRRDGHVRLSFLANAMPERVRAYWLALMDMIVLVILVCAGLFSLGIVRDAVPNLFQHVPLSRSLLYIPFPLGCAFSVCQIINTNYKRITGANMPVVSAD